MIISDIVFDHVRLTVSIDLDLYFLKSCFELWLLSTVTCTSRNGLKIFLTS